MAQISTLQSPDQGHFSFQSVKQGDEFSKDLRFRFGGWGEGVRNFRRHLKISDFFP